jgi:uncharacterized protein
MTSASIPLFPLHAVLFPGGPLRLRIFEPRYVDMIGRCMRANEGFGVAMIVEGAEVGRARTAPIGTTAHVRDFETLSGGLLGITAAGGHRFRIRSVTTQSDGLNVAEIENLMSDPRVAVPKQFEPLALLARNMYSHVQVLYGNSPAEFDDAGWVSTRLGELLPLALPDRQHCLELDDPLERLGFVEGLLREKGIGDRG